MAENVADPRKVDRKRERAREDKQTREQVLRTLMADPRGRRYIWLQLQECCVFHQVLVLGPSGYAGTAFNEGKRMLGLKLLNDITRLAPNDYMRMTQENSGVELTETDNGRRDDDGTDD